VRDIRESKELIQQEVSRNTESWKKYSESMMKKLKLLIPESNTKELKEITNVMGRLALDMGSLRVSIKDAVEKSLQARTRQEKKDYENLANTFGKMYDDLQDKLLKNSQNNNVSAMILQGITDMGVKLVNTLKESAVPVVAQKDNLTIFNQQLIFMMMDRLPKIQELFKVTRDENHQIKFIPKEGKKDECIRACNAFLRNTYNIDPKDLTPDENFDFITLSKYKTSTSPPSTQELVLGRKNKGKEPEKIDPYLEMFSKPPKAPKISSKTPKASASKTPLEIKANPIFTMGDEELHQETTFNTIMNEANSAYKFDSSKEYRQYKINQQNLISMQDIIDSFNSKPTLVEQPQPFLNEIINIPKKSPLDVFGLGPPIFDGIKEHAQKFITDFIQFCNAYTSFSNDSDLSKAFIKCQKFDDIKKSLSSYLFNNPNASFEDLYQYFITKFGTRTIAENIKFWNNFSLNFKFPNDSRARLETIAESLHFSKYDCSVRLFSVLPYKWKKELIDINIIPSENNDNWEEMWEFINNTLA